MIKILAEIIFLLLLFSFQNDEQIISRFNQVDFSPEKFEKISHFIDFQDTIRCDTLNEFIGKDRMPVMYSRNIFTSVCIDGECRKVKMELFWHITGRYMGFKIEKGEFLSKTKHVAFTEQEYTRLHNLLENPNSALALYSINDLTTGKKKPENGIDAVTSATIAAVLEYIVEGAVYTTYTLWHIVHGPVKKEIEKLTVSKMNSELVMQLLESKKTEDVVWGLNHLPAHMAIKPVLMEKMVGIISGEDIYLVERALNSLQAEKISPEVQMKLAEIFNKTGFMQQRFILMKFNEIIALNEKTAMVLSSNLEHISGVLIKNILELFLKHNIKNSEITKKAVNLLGNENRFIAVQSAKFLELQGVSDKKILKKIEKLKGSGNSSKI